MLETFNSDINGKLQKKELSGKIVTGRIDIIYWKKSSVHQQSQANEQFRANNQLNKQVQANNQLNKRGQSNNQLN